MKAEKEHGGTEILGDNVPLDHYVAAAELMALAGLSPNAFRYWKNLSSARYEGSRTLFLRKSTVPEKYRELLGRTTDLSGCVLSGAFCRFTGLSPSLLVTSNKSAFKQVVALRRVGRTKLVDLRAFYDRLGLRYDYYIYIDKCCHFSPLEKKIPLTKTLCVGYY